MGAGWAKSIPIPIRSSDRRDTNGVKTMRQRRRTGVRILGVVFVLLSLYSLGVLTQTVIYHFEQRLPIISMFLEIRAQTEGDVLSFPKIIFVFEIIAIAAILWAVFVYLVAAAGVLRLKRWVRYLILVLAIDAVATILWNYWILCSQIYSLLFAPVWFAILIAAFLFLNRSVIKRESNADVKRVGAAARLLIGVTLLFVVLKLASVPFFIGLLKPGFISRRANLKPVKTEYRITDPDYLAQHYEKQDIFGCSIFIPRGVSFIRVERNDGSPDLSLHLGGEGPDGRMIRYMLRSRSPVASAAERFGFKSAYEFERVVHHPSWRTLNLWMKVAVVEVWFNQMEDAISPYWRGFVGTSPGYGTCIRSSLHDLESDNSVYIEMVFERESEALSHAKDVLAAVRFETGGKDASTYFEEGKKALSKREYVDASFDFLNAFHMDQQNPEYAYRFARCLFENTSGAFRWWRLYTAKEFLRYALELDMTYHEAEELLATVEKEIEDLRGK